VNSHRRRRFIGEYFAAIQSISASNSSISRTGSVNPACTYGPDAPNRHPDICLDLYWL
jgi:hypothetical protein